MVKQCYKLEYGYGDDSSKCPPRFVIEARELSLSLVSLLSYVAIDRNHRPSAHKTYLKEDP